MIRWHITEKLQDECPVISWKAICVFKLLWIACSVTDRPSSFLAWYLISVRGYPLLPVIHPYSLIRFFCNLLERQLLTLLIFTKINNIHMLFLGEGLSGKFRLKKWLCCASLSGLWVKEWFKKLKHKFKRGVTCFWLTKKKKPKRLTYNRILYLYLFCIHIFFARWL